MKKNKSPFAVIDIGSSSVRLVIFDSVSYSANTIFNEKVVMNLGKIICSNRSFSKEMIEELIIVLKRFFEISKNIKKKNIIVFGSAAVRTAKNKQILVNLILKKFGIRLKVLSEKEEGLLAAKGLFFSRNIVNGLVGDFGGGSLELVKVKKRDQSEFLGSSNLGHVVLQGLGQPDGVIISNFIDKNLKKIESKNFKNFYAIGGSFRALAKVHMHIESDEIKIIQDYSVNAENFIHSIRKVIFKEGTINENFLKKISKSRCQIIPYSLVILEKIVKKFKIKNIYFTNTGIREGILYKNISEKESDPFFSQVKKISNLAKTRDVKKIFDWVKSFDGNIKLCDRIVKAACWLMNIGANIHPEHRRVFALEEILYYPFNHLERKDRYLLSLILYFRYSNSIKDKFVTTYTNKVSPRELESCKVLGQLLRIVHHLTGRLNYKVLKLCKISMTKKNKVSLKINKDPHLVFSQSLNRGIENISNIYKNN